MSSGLLRDVEVDDVRTDVRVVGGRVGEMAPGLRVGRTDEWVRNGHGGALLPGLHDHHIHLLALAAQRHSLVLGPPEVVDSAGFAAVLRGADASFPPGAWLRATGYHESVAGDIDRWRLDAVVANRPVRIQHRSGAQWVLNSAALGQIGPLDGGDGIEHDPGGRPTGRLYGLDRWLRDRLPAERPPDLAPVGRALSRYGVTGVTDASPFDRLDDLRPLADAVARGALPQQVVVTGGPALAGATMPAPLVRGPVKLVLADHALPALDDVAEWMRAAHAEGRAVAVHCVTRIALVLAMTAWDAIGSRPGDRIEHAGVVPAELRAPIASLRLTVVTQPGFVAERGDRYLVEVDRDDQPFLYPCATLLDAGIAVAASTDAPFGHADPWRAIVAAVQRRTVSGVVVGRDERLAAGRALALFLGPPHDPGGPRRRVAPGAPGDLCLLDRPLRAALRRPSADHVVATLHAGVLHPLA